MDVGRVWSSFQTLEHSSKQHFWQVFDLKLEAA